jgi:hypothetical protein
MGGGLYLLSNRAKFKNLYYKNYLDNKCSIQTNFWF